MTNINSFNDFIPLALRTESHIAEVRTNINVVLAALAINIASAEILDGVKKGVFYNKNTKLQTETLQHANTILGSLSTLMDSASLSDEALSTTVQINPRILHGLLGLVTEAGEISQILRDVLSGMPLDAVNLQEEMTGDMGWYRAILNDELALDEYQGLQNVINKLRVRYPEKYSDTLADVDNRNLSAERSQLSVGITTSSKMADYTTTNVVLATMTMDSPSNKCDPEPVNSSASSSYCSSYSSSSYSSDYSSYDSSSSSSSDSW